METVFFQRIQILCTRDRVEISNVLKTLGLSTSKGTAWKDGAIPKGDILLKLSNYFHVSTDYLLDNTDDPTPAGEKEGSKQIADLSEKDARLIKWFRSLPPEKQRAILIAQDGPEDLAE